MAAIVVSAMWETHLATQKLLEFKQFFVGCTLCTNLSYAGARSAPYFLYQPRQNYSSPSWVA